MESFLHGILEEILEIMFVDNHIEIGSEDGLQYCELALTTSRDSLRTAIISGTHRLPAGEYRVRKSSTVFLADSTNRNNFRNAYVAAAYDVEALLRR
ncbi:MAG: hypothetical protein HY962_04350 [Ignavibacteriae bacterium]|nr:hypothetical protein [Ignavibacteriota bacterium]